MEYRPLHEVIVGQLAHLCEIYATEARIAGVDGMTTKLIGLGAEISALCAVLDNGAVPAKHLEEVTDQLRRVRDEHLDADGVRARPDAIRFLTLCSNLGVRGAGMDELRPLHEVILRWLEAQMETFVVAVVTHQDDQVFVVGVEIQACANALARGVIPEAELQGAITWIGRVEERVPVAKNPTVQAVATALGGLLLNLEGRDLFADPVVEA